MLTASPHQSHWGDEEGGWFEGCKGSHIQDSRFKDSKPARRGGIQETFLEGEFLNVEF